MTIRGGCLFVSVVRIERQTHKKLSGARAEVSPRDSTHCGDSRLRRLLLEVQGCYHPQLTMPRKLPWLQDKTLPIPPRVTEKRLPEKKGRQKSNAANVKSDNDSVLTKTGPG